MAEESFEVDLDLLDDAAVEEEIDINTEVNPLDEPNPVEDGVHRVKVIAATNGAWQAKSWTDKKSGEEHPFLVAKFSLQVLDEGVDFNKRIFPTAITTIAFDGKNEMAYILLNIYGGDDAAKARIKTLNNYVKLGKAFKEALAGEPIVRVTTKWVAQYKTGEQKKGKDVYRTALSGMRNFKKRPDGTFDPNTVTKGSEVRARAEVIAYGPDEA